MSSGHFPDIKARAWSLLMVCFIVRQKSETAPWVTSPEAVYQMPCYQKVTGSFPLVCMSKCPWARYWTPNCWRAGQQLATVAHSWCNSLSHESVGRRQTEIKPDKVFVGVGVCYKYSDSSRESVKCCVIPLICVSQRVRLSCLCLLLFLWRPFSVSDLESGDIFSSPYWRSSRQHWANIHDLNLHLNEQFRDFWFALTWSRCVCGELHLDVMFYLTIRPLTFVFTFEVSYNVTNKI